jgi:hypothetical protein
MAHLSQEAAMWTLGEIALAILITPGVGWLLHQLVQSFGGLPDGAPSLGRVSVRRRPG